jgi:predicted nucleic acid-binding protein
MPDPMRPQCRALVSQLLREGLELVAPALWSYETTSAVCKAVHFDLVTQEEGRLMLSTLAALDVRLVPANAEQARQAFEWTVRLNRAAAYDSFYLALAETMNCDLWTADRRLANAVNEHWIRCVGEK